MTDQAAPPRASFRSFEESTKDDWMLIMEQRSELNAALADRILCLLYTSDAADE